MAKKVNKISNKGNMYDIEDRTISTALAQKQNKLCAGPGIYLNPTSGTIYVDSDSVINESTKNSGKPVTTKAVVMALEAYATESDLEGVETELEKKADTSDLATVALTGDYNNLSNKPSIPDVTGLTSNVSTLTTKTAAIEDNITEISGNVSDVEDLAENNESEITTIKGLIPTEASASNQLADKEFVNSSINSNTATFFGSYDTYAAFQAAWGTGETKNDYAVVLADENKNNACTRYKYNGTAWSFEYKVNDTPLTAEQVAALNSGITTDKVSQIETNRTDILNKADKATTISGYNISDAYTKTETDTKLSGKVNTTDVIGVSNGGTGKATAKAAQNSLLGTMNEVVNDVTDDSFIVQEYGTPTDNTGAVYKRKTSRFWTYIKNKIYSVLGLKEGVFSGIAAKAMGDFSGNNIEETYIKKTERSIVELNSLSDQGAFIGQIGFYEETFYKWNGTAWIERFSAEYAYPEFHDLILSQNVVKVKNQSAEPARISIKELKKTTAGAERVIESEDLLKVKFRLLPSREFHDAEIIKIKDTAAYNADEVYYGYEKPFYFQVTNKALTADNKVLILYKR